MKVTQISTMLNDVFGTVLGDSGLIAEDLSNIVDSGRIISSSKALGDDFDNYAGAIVDKVGRTIFWDRVYVADDLGIWRDAFEYGSVLEKIRCEVGDYADNCEWNLTADTNSNNTLDYNDNIATHIAEMFKFYPASVQAKYFNSKTTFKTTISITRRQLREAFNSAAAMGRFIGMIEQRVRSKMEISKNALQKMVIANLIGEHVAQGKQVIDLAALYNSETGQTAGTLAAALNDKTKARFIAKKMTFYREMMTEPSKLYSATGTFWNHTPIADSRMIVLADVDSALRFDVYGDTYNDEFVKLDNYKTVPFWQTSGTANAMADRSGINITTSNGNAVIRNNIVGVLFDRDAAMICNDEPDVRTQYNPDGNFTNFFYCADCSYYNDFDENAIVFVWGASDSGLQNSLTLAKGNATGNTVVSAVAPVAGSGETFQYLVSTTPKAVSIGEAVPDDYASLTVGAAGTGTDITAGADKYIEVVRVKNSKVIGYGNKLVTSAVVK